MASPETCGTIPATATATATTMATALASTFSAWMGEGSFSGSFPAVWAERYHTVLLPALRAVAVRLELPAWHEYRDAVHSCTTETLEAVHATLRLWRLTLKPLVLLAWILLGHLGRFVLEHGGRSLQKGAVHARLALLHLVRFQASLNRTQLLGEAGLVGMCIGLYYLRRWLQRQTYWAAFVRWHTAKKRRLVQSYTDTVHKIAKVSKILAMALPHSLFLGLGMGLKIAFPGAIRWVTYETPTLNILTVYYPFVSTLLWVHTQHQNNDNDKTNDKTNDANRNEGAQTSNNKDIITTAKAKAKANTKYGISERKQKFETAGKNKTKTKEKSPPGFVTETQALATTKYWLDYWQLYAVIQATGSCLSMVPIVGRFLVSHPFFSFLTGECKLFFFVWVFGMEKILGSNRTTTTGGDAFLAEALPLRLLHKSLTPLVKKLHSFVSDAIPKETWQKWVVSKTKTTLGIAVLVRALSEDTKDWLVHVVEEARVLTLPSITLLMPGFVTQFGVAYVRYLVPSAKSAEATSKRQKTIYLQYWILHCGIAGLLQKLEGVLWWIPFSTHAIFLLWSYLILPKSIQSWYGMLGAELMAFGILPSKQRNNSTGNASGGGGGGDNSQSLAIGDTKTAWLFQSLVKRLPSAVAEVPTKDDDDNDADGNNVNNNSNSETNQDERHASAGDASTGDATDELSSITNKSESESELVFKLYAKMKQSESESESTEAATTKTTATTTLPPLMTEASYDE